MEWKVRFGSSFLRRVAVACICTLWGTCLTLGTVAGKLSPDDDIQLLTHLQNLVFPNCFFEDVSLSGTSAGMETTSSAMECQEKCKATESCDVFVFDGGGTCTLLPLGGVKDPIKKKGSVIGPKTCRDDCREEGMVSGNPIRVISDGSVLSLEECAAHCNESEPCVHATFDYLSDRCYLTGEKTGESVSVRGVFTKAKRCNSHDNDVAKNYWLEGPDLVDGLKTDSWKECRDRGQVTSTCTYWSWDSNDNTCKLKNYLSLRIWSPKEGWYSGPTWPSRNSCYRKGFRFPGSGDGDGFATSVEECQQQCVTKNGCNLFSFESATLKCMLLGSNRELALEAAEGWVSGPPICSSRDWCVEWGKVYKGGDVLEGEGTILTVDAEGCRRSCQEKSDECVTWSFRRDSLICSLRGLEGIRTREADPEVVSGQATCGSLAVCERKHTSFGVSRHLTDLRGLRNSTECHEACYDDPRCYHYSFMNKTCRLYPKVSQLQDLEGAVGGPAEC